jgi:Arc/MetJ-type ribon-helix-helix transcriptional regulator
MRTLEKCIGVRISNAMREKIEKAIREGHAGNISDFVQKAIEASLNSVNSHRELA